MKNDCFPLRKRRFWRQREDVENEANKHTRSRGERFHFQRFPSLEQFFTPNGRRVRSHFFCCPKLHTKGGNNVRVKEPSLLECVAFLDASLPAKKFSRFLRRLFFIFSTYSHFSPFSPQLSRFPVHHVILASARPTDRLTIVFALRRQSVLHYK